VLGEDFTAQLAAAQDGDETGFAALWRDLQPPLLRYLGVAAGPAAEDLASETWIRVARDLATFHGDERGFRGWVFTIARRRLIQSWRTQGRRPSTPVGPDEMAELAGFEAGPEGSVVARDAAAELVCGLPEDQAEVVLLRVVAGLEAAEVAQIVGKSAGAVRVLQHRALKRIGQRLATEAVTP